MIGKTLGIYIATRFLKVLFGMFLGMAFLIITVDFIEQLRRAADNDTVSLTDLYLVSVLRAPVFIEKAFPFACLFAAMITLTNLNSKLELVVARSAGISAWQFLLPISLSAILVGGFVATIYNPLAIMAFNKSTGLQAEIMESGGLAKLNTIKGHWIKQQDDQGTSVINALLAQDNGEILNQVKIIRFDGAGGIRERIDAERAIHLGDHWKLVNAKVTHQDGKITRSQTLNLPTRLTKDALLGASTPPESVPFWSLRNTAKKIKKSGTNSKPYMVQFHSLTALPLFLLAMVMVAATVCLRFVRFGQVGRMILGGIVAGFVLYTVTNLVTALGSNGVVPPAVASWAPVFVAILFGMSILLHQEDG